MNTVNLEHVNITVSDPDEAARLLNKMFGWAVRWAGESRNNGRTVHVGSDSSYLALYTRDRLKQRTRAEGEATNLNHVAVLVDDLELTEQKVLAAGAETFNHADYQPGRRFYFHLNDEIEMEVVSYA